MCFIAPTSDSFFGRSLQSYSTSKTSQALKNAGSVFGHLDDGLLGAHACTTLASRVIKGSHQSSAATAGEQIETTRCLLDVIRLVPLLSKFASGQAFFKQSQLPEDKGTGRLEVDGGRFVFRSFFDILSDVIQLAVRVLTTAKWPHKIKAVNLRQHAARIGHAIMGCWVTVCTIGFARSLHKRVTYVAPNDQNNQETLKIKRSLSIDVWQNFTYLANLPYEFGLMTGNTAALVTGSVFAFITSISNLIIDTRGFSDIRVRQFTP